MKINIKYQHNMEAKVYNVDKVTFECPVEVLSNILDKKWVGIKNANITVRYVNRK